jgi:hypothetical protein
MGYYVVQSITAMYPYCTYNTARKGRLKKRMSLLFASAYVLSSLTLAIGLLVVAWILLWKLVLRRQKLVQEIFFSDAPSSSASCQQQGKEKGG